MDSIKDINGLLKDYGKIDRTFSDSKISVGGKQVSKASSDESQPVTRDRVEISNTGKSMLAQSKDVDVSRYIDHLENVTTIDDDKVKTIRQRIEKGYYTEPAIEEKIINDLIVEDASVLKRINSTDNSADENLSAVKEKVASGAYNTDEVLNKIADEIIGATQII